MPIHDVGYRPWKGNFTSMISRWWVITEAGIKINMKNNWVKRTLFLAWLPTFAAAIGIFFAEKLMENWQRGPSIVFSTEDGIDVTKLSKQEKFELLDRDGDGILKLSELPLGVQEALHQADFNQDGDIDPLEFSLGNYGNLMMYYEFEQMTELFPNFAPVRNAIRAGDENQTRNAIWSWILLNFFRSFQGISVVLLLGLIVPPLIAQDVRSRAFQLYYARPIVRTDYIMGKLGIPVFFVCLITAAPALLLYFFGVMMSPDLSVLYDTWQIPFQILAGTAVLVLPTCTLALMFSAMTFETRFAAFSWFAVWGLGLVAWSTIQTVQITQNPEQPFESNWTLVSLYNTLYKSQGWIFGLEEKIETVLPSFVMLASITILSLIILYRRVSAPLRA